jgi:membrane-bound lytic murein transglycosylase MltF
MTKTISLLIIALLLNACGDTDHVPTPGSVTLEQAAQDDMSDKPQNDSSQDATGQIEQPILPLSFADRGLPPELEPLSRAWTGDFDSMIERRSIRVLTIYQVGGYFLDGLRERGMTFDLVKLFEKSLNERLGTGHLKIHVVLIPMERHQLLDALNAGYGDIIAAGVTITDDRRKVVDFTDPLSRGMNEVLVTGKDSAEIRSIDDLSGREVYVRRGSSYRESLEALNQSFTANERAEVILQDIPGELEDEDVLEMVSAGLLPMTVLDDFRARFWAEIFENLQVREDIVLASGRQIGWAFRKDSPQLAAALNEFVKTHKQGTLMGNILIKRYLKNTNWVKSALNPEDLGRFHETVELFKRYASQYEFDHLMIAAQGYQESGLDQSVRSSAGAIGVMQLLRSTAEDPNVGIPEIEEIESNIHAGVKYMHFIRNRYFSDNELDAVNRALFSFAAYNAGPGRVRGLRKMAHEAGLDRNKWFKNVEIIAAREIGRETVQYVSNIYKYYLAYQLLTRKQAERINRSSEPEN